MKICLSDPRHKFWRNTLQTEAIACLLAVCPALLPLQVRGEQPAPLPFGADYEYLDSKATGRWWGKPCREREVDLDVTRSQVLAFSLYAVANGSLKLTAQTSPHGPSEERRVALHLLQDGIWKQIDSHVLQYPGWSGHFRIENWNDRLSVEHPPTHSGGNSLKGCVAANPQGMDGACSLRPASRKNG